MTRAHSAFAVIRFSLSRRANERHRPDDCYNSFSEQIALPMSKFIAAGGGQRENFFGPTRSVLPQRRAEVLEGTALVPSITAVLRGLMKAIKVLESAVPITLVIVGAVLSVVTLCLFIAYGLKAALMTFSLI
jgi:hypothetical protein